jgi:hypothetical protein
MRKLPGALRFGEFLLLVQPFSAEHWISGARPTQLRAGNSTVSGKYRH